MDLLTLKSLQLHKEAFMAFKDGTISQSSGGGSDIPDGVFSGTRAITQQSYLEANVKNGVQHEFAFYQPVFTAGSTVDFIIITGNKPVSIKSINFEFNGRGFNYTLYIDPTYTGGSSLQYYNKSTINPVAGEAQIIGGATVSSAGTQVGAMRTFLGSDPQSGNRNVTTVAVDITDLETVLAPNSVFMYRRTSIDTEDQAVSSYATWYEGDLDLPLP